jgi:hypothetical protein
MRKVVPVLLFFAALATLFGEEAFRIWRESHHDPHELYDLWPGASFWTPTLIVQGAMTLIFVGACLYVIVSKRYGPAERHWAFGTLGTILGFWLRTA